MHKHIAELLGSKEFYMISRAKPLNPKFTLIDIGIMNNDKIKIIRRIRGGAETRPRNNPINAQFDD